MWNINISPTGNEYLKEGNFIFGSIVVNEGETWIGNTRILLLALPTGTQSNALTSRLSYTFLQLFA